MTSYLPGGDPTSVGGRRIVAYLIDWVLFISIIPAILFFATADLTRYTDGPTCTNLRRSGEIDVTYFCRRVESTDASGAKTYDTIVMRKRSLLIPNAVGGGYLVLVLWLTQGLTGATLGKAVVGIRTVRPDGRPPGLGRQLIRGVAGVVDALPFCLMPLVPVVGLITMFVTKGHRRVGDLAAGTYVVRASAAGSPIVIPGATSPAGPTMVAPAVGTPPQGPVTDPGAPPTPGFAPTPPPPPGGGVTPPPPPGGMTPPPPPGSVATSAPGPQPGFAPPGGTNPEPPAGPATADATPTATGSDPSATSPMPQPGVTGPQWDPQRNAYVQWDPTEQRWLTYDDTTGTWKPLD